MELEPKNLSPAEAKVEFPEECKPEVETDTDDDLNGLIFNGILIPETTIETLLSYVSVDDVPAVTKVCVIWKDIITLRRSFWKLIFKRCAREAEWNVISMNVKEKANAWAVYFAVLKNRILSKNLVKNPSGHDGFENWTRTDASRFDNHNFIVEAPPAGIAPLPPQDPPDSQIEGLNDSAFTSTYVWCSMQQKIDLWEAGLTPEIMKVLLPFQFTFTQMVGCRFDCGGMYKIRTHLEQHSNEQIAITNEQLLEGTRPRDAGWSKVESVITVDENQRDALNGIRYFVITTMGKDNQYWAGHYGIKLSRISVTVKCLSGSDRNPL